MQSVQIVQTVEKVEEAEKVDEPSSVGDIIESTTLETVTTTVTSAGDTVQITETHEINTETTSNTTSETTADPAVETEIGFNVENIDSNKLSEPENGDMTGINHELLFTCNHMIFTKKFLDICSINDSTSHSIGR